MDNMEVCRAINATAYVQNATFASATCSNVAERFSSVNKNSHHIIEGYDPEIYYYEDIKKIHNVIFIGNATMQRVQDISNLRAKGIDITVFGQGWPSGMKANAPVWGEDERTEINQSKVVLNLCHDDVIFSDRVTKALACRANVVSQYSRDLANLIQTGLPAMEDRYSNIHESEWIAITSKDMGEFPKHIHHAEVQEKIDLYMAMMFSWKAVCAKILEETEAYEYKNR